MRQKKSIDKRQIVRNNNEKEMDCGRQVTRKKDLRESPGRLSYS